MMLPKKVHEAVLQTLRSRERMFYEQWRRATDVDEIQYRAGQWHEALKQLMVHMRPQGDRETWVKE